LWLENGTCFSTLEIISGGIESLAYMTRN
jgi:hypothetical protein